VSFTKLFYPNKQQQKKGGEGGGGRGEMGVRWFERERSGLGFS